MFLLQVLPEKFLFRTASKTLDTIEHVAEKDLVRSEEKIRALEERMDLDRAAVFYARETRKALATLEEDLVVCDEEDMIKRAEAAKRFVDALPPKPEMKGWGRRRRLSAPYAPTSGARPVLV